MINKKLSHIGKLSFIYEINNKKYGRYVEINISKIKLIKEAFKEATTCITALFYEILKDKLKLNYYLKNYTFNKLKKIPKAKKIIDKINKILTIDGENG